MKTGLEVFDFKEEDELPGKFCSKFKTPSLDNPAILKTSQGVVIVKKKRRTDANEGHTHIGSHNGTAPSVETVRENPATQYATGGPGAAWKSQSPTHENVPCSNMDTFESESSFTVVEEARFSCDEALSPGKCQSTCEPAASPLNSEPINVKSDADGSDESSPSTSISNIAEGTVDGHASDSFFSAPEMDGISIAVDYVLYGDIYCTGCMVIFSSDGIKISGIPAYGEQENFCFDRGIDDIIRMESQHLQRSGTVTVKLHFLPKDAAQDVRTDGVELLEFALMEPNWSGKFEEITYLNAKYLAVSSIVRDVDFSMDGGADILKRRPYFPTFDEAVEDVVYPKGDSDAVSISKRDFDLLQPETFVNDTIIDFYIKYLKNQIPPEERHRFHFFNSFFFRKLADLDKDPSSASDGRAAFLRVQKWTRKVDIFGKDYIFIPVNFSLHWSLLVICHPGEVAGFKEEDLGKSLRVPCILHMDSIKGTHAGLKNLVQSYLWEEWKARQKDTSDDLSTKFLNLRFVPLELPQQENLYDCGLFLLHYLELFLAEAPPNFSPFKITKSSEFLTVDWFPPAEASLKRALIQRLISVLLDNHNRDISFAECSDERESCFPHRNMKESAVQLVSETCTSAQGKVSSSDAKQGIEITLLQSSMRNIDCVSDSLVLRELFEPEAASGSLLAHFSSFDEPSYCRHNGVVSQQIEEDEENEDPFVYFPSGDDFFHQTGSMTPHSGSIPCSLRGYRADLTWKQGKNDALSPETSACASDDSDVNIIENSPVQKNHDLCQIDGVDKQASQSTENTHCLAGRHTSISNEELKSSVRGLTEDLGDLADEVIESDEKQSNDNNEIAESEKQMTEVAELGKKQANEKRTIETNTMAESDEHQLNDSNTMPKDNDMESKEVELDKKHQLEDSNSKRESNDMEIIEDCNEVAESDLHLATKKLRVTLTRDLDL